VTLTYTSLILKSIEHDCTVWRRERVKQQYYRTRQETEIDIQSSHSSCHVSLFLFIGIRVSKKGKEHWTWFFLNSSFTVLLYLCHLVLHLCPVNCFFVSTTRASPVSISDFFQHFISRRQGKVASKITIYLRTCHPSCYVIQTEFCTSISKQLKAECDNCWFLSVRKL